MADLTPSTIRALLTLDTRFGAAKLAASGASGADYTQAERMIGAVTPGSTTTPQIVLSGTPTADTSFAVQCVRGGNPGAAVDLVGGTTPGIAAVPGVVWQLLGSSPRGWDPPTAISEFEFLDRSTTANEWLNPHVISRPDGSAYLVVQHSERYVATYTRTIGGTWTAAGVVYDAGSAVYASPEAACPCLVSLPGDGLLCLYWDSVEGCLRSSVSTDNGATWSTGLLADGVLATAGGAPVSRIRAAWSNGQVLALVWQQVGAADYVVQFASVDNGASFAIVSTVTDRDAGYAEVVAAPGGSGFVVATLETARDTTGSTVTPYARRIGSAFDFVMATTPTLAQTDADTERWGNRSGASGTALTAGELALTVDHAGTLWLFGLNFASAREGLVSRSADGGATWALQSRLWYDCIDATRGPRQMAACWQGGRVMMPHTLNASTATASLAVSYLGGDTTVCRPQLSSAFSAAAYVGDYTVAWLPYALPEATGATWTYTSVGGSTISLTANGMRVQHAGVLDSNTWTATPTTSNANGLHLLADLRSTVGNVYVQARIGAAGPTSYEVRVMVTPTSIVFRDVTSGTDLATVTTTAGATGVQIILGIGDTAGGAVSGDCQAWYRAWGSNADREFVLIHQATTLTQGADTTDRIQFGTVAGSATTDSHVRLVQYAEGADCGVNMYVATYTATARLLGVPVSPYPTPLAETGVSLSALAGPLAAGQTWTAPVDHGYSVTRTDPTVSPSPRATWRSTADTVSQRIVWTFTEATTMQSPLAAIYLDGCNFPTATLDGWNGAAWVTIATIDMRLGATAGIKFTRQGEIVYCGTGGGSAITDYIDRGELAGCTIKLAAGQYRKIATNSGGRWTGAAVTTTRPVVTLESYTAGDATSGSASEIWTPRACVVFRGATTGYTRYSLHIPSSPTADGYYTVGAIVIGPLVVLGEPDTERQYSRATNVQTTTARNGTRTQRRMGRAARAIQVSWTDGIDGSNVHDAVPDYVLDYTGGTPISTPAALAGDILAVVSESDVTPVVYLPAVAVPGSATTSLVVSADLMLYGDIITDTIQTDVVTGDEHQVSGKGEYVRVGTVRLEEVI